MAIVCNIESSLGGGEGEGADFSKSLGKKKGEGGKMAYLLHKSAAGIGRGEKKRGERKSSKIHKEGRGREKRYASLHYKEGREGRRGPVIRNFTGGGGGGRGKALLILIALS